MSIVPSGVVKAAQSLDARLCYLISRIAAPASSFKDLLPSSRLPARAIAPWSIPATYDCVDFVVKRRCLIGPCDLPATSELPEKGPLPKKFDRRL